MDIAFKKIKKDVMPKRNILNIDDKKSRDVRLYLAPRDLFYRQA
jgi:hypothetical protein